MYNCKYSTETKDWKYWNMEENVQDLLGHVPKWEHESALTGTCLQLKRFHALIWVHAQANLNRNPIVKKNTYVMLLYCSTTYCEIGKINNC